MNDTANCDGAIALGREVLLHKRKPSEILPIRSTRSISEKPSKCF